MDRRVFVPTFLSPSRIKVTSQRSPNKPSRSAKPRFKYIRGELIGKGSYGQVYLGLNAKTGEVLAIKQVELTSSHISQRQKEIIEAFKREIDMLKGLKHEHIVRYMGYEEAPKSLSIFLEYVPGGTIKTCLEKKGRFREDVTKSFTSQILSGLEYLHSKAIIHRDLKSDNILLEPSGICKISDFGISKQVEDINDLRAFTGMRGTACWMAPEIFHAKGRGYDAKVDIWSVGCVLLEMWSGELPWKGQDTITVMFKLSQYQQPPVPANLRLNPIAEQFRLKCFEINPEDRPTAVQLKTHRYLQLPLNWTFPYVMHDRKANRRSRTRTVHRSSFTVDPNAPPMPTLKSSTGKTTQPHTPLQPSDTEANRVAPTDVHPVLDIDAPSDLVINERSVPVVDTPHPSPPHAQNNGPPVVMITPPGSPKEPSFSCEDLMFSTKSSDISERTTTSKWRRLRRVLVVANPDGDSDIDDHKKSVFQPPPLPETSRRISSRAYSSERRPPPTLVVKDTPSPASPSSSQRPESSSSSTANSSLSLTMGRAHPKANKDSSQTDIPDDSDTDEDIHLWNRPPIDLQKAPKLASASSPALAQPLKSAFQPPDGEAYTLDTHAIKAARNSKLMKTHQSIRPRDSWSVRPDVQEINDDLGAFFPDHDVAQAKAPDTTSQDSSKRQTAEISHPFRRMTRLLRGYSGEPK